MFHSVDILKDIQAQGTGLSDHSEGLLLRGKGVARIYRSFFYNKD